MKELEIEAIEKLIDVYQDLEVNEIDEILINKAKKVYNEFIPGNKLLSDVINFAVSRLFSVAYPNVDPDITTPSKEEIKEIILKLKKLNESLNKTNNAEFRKW